MKSQAQVWSSQLARPWLRETPTAHDHKYTRGVLGARIGSPEYPGAALLGVEAAWRTGLGMVRYLPFGEGGGAIADPLCNDILQQRPETVFVPGRTDAWLVGSGFDAATFAETGGSWLTQTLQGADPVVVDAGALNAVVGAVPVVAPVIITPHSGEFAQLAKLCGISFTSESREERVDAIISGTEIGATVRAPVGVETEGPAEGEPAEIVKTMLAVAQKLGVTVLLKGSITRVVTPAGRVGQVGPATAWLATAGTGDVLAGILGALAARHSAALRADPELMLELGLSAALLHDRAAREASFDEASPVTALDVARAIPGALRSL